MTIETKKNANGKISAYYIDGVKVRKGEVEYYACNPAYNGVIEVDYCTARYNLPKIYKCGKAVVFKNWVDGSDVMTKVAAERLGLKVGRKISMFPAIYRVDKDTEVKDEFVIVPETDGTEEAREEIMSTPLVTEEAMEEAYIGEVMNAYDAEIATKKEAFYQALTEALLLKFTLIELEEAMLETVVSEEAMEIAINAEIEAANVATENAEFDANEEIINCTNDIITSDAAYRQMIDTELYNAARAAGNYSVTINGETVFFKNHKIVSIDAKNRFGLNMRVINGRKQFRRYNYVIARATVAKMYMNSELAAVQEKKFREFFIKDGAAKSGFFAVKVYVTFDEGRVHIYANYFDAFNQARDFVASVKEFVGNVQCEIYIQRDEQCGKIYYKRDAQGNETYDLPDTDFFKGTPAAEIQARIDELKKAKADNAQYKDNPDVDGYVWTELCVANAAIDKTIEYYEFILHENALVTTAEIDGSEEDDANEAFNLLPGVDELNDFAETDPWLIDDPAEYTDHNDRYNRGEKIAADLTAKLRHFDPTVEVTFDIGDDDEDVFYLQYDGIFRTRFIATGIEPSFHAMKKYDNEMIAPPVIKPADDFAAELARLKAEQIAAQKAVEAARLALYNAQKAYDKATIAYEKFGAQKAKEISQRRLPPAGISAKIAVVTQDGRILDKPDLKKLRIDFFPDDTLFEINTGWDVLGSYKTPAQVDEVISRLKAAIIHGDKEFTFPTADKLSAMERRKQKLDECKTKRRRLHHHKALLTKAEFDAMKEKLVAENAALDDSDKASNANKYGKEVA